MKSLMLVESGSPTSIYTCIVFINFLYILCYPPV